MPKTKNPKGKRIGISLPKVMVQEVDRIVETVPIYSNRQQFVESAVREKLEKAFLIEAKLQTEVEQRQKQNPSQNRNPTKETPSSEI